MRLALLGITVGLGTLASTRAGLWLLLWWPAASFGWVSSAYLANRPRWLGKRVDGSLSLAHGLVIAPYLLFSAATWHLLCALSREPRAQEIGNGVWIGRRIRSPQDTSVTFRSVLDWTAELPGPSPRAETP